MLRHGNRFFQLKKNSWLGVFVFDNIIINFMVFNATFNKISVISTFYSKKINMQTIKLFVTELYMMFECFCGLWFKDMV
jgi:type I site-specific restriction endonuclease